MHNTDQINYSIIIPHKNIPDLLRRCLDSIPTRTDTQIIVVDDNSDQAFIDFANFPGMERDDVKVIFNKESKGGGSARNSGLKIATGKWVLFADADDFFLPCLNNVLDTCYTTEADIIFFDASCLNSDTLLPAHNNRAVDLNRFIELYKTNPQKGDIQLRYQFAEPWAKIIRLDMIRQHNIQFEETFIHNDVAFSYLSGYYAGSIRVIDEVLYCITERPGSVSKQLDVQKTLTRINVLAVANKFYIDHSIPATWDWLLCKQLADLLISDSKLYKQAIKIVERSGLNISDVKKTVLKHIPKALGRKYIKRIKLSNGFFML